MQKNRIVLAITAAVIVALLFAGVGYAFSGDARTYNPGDKETLAYMTVEPGDFNAIFDGSTIFDTYIYDSSGKKTAYAFKSPLGEPVNGYTATLLGTKNMTITNQTGEDLTALKVAITSSGTVGTTDFVYIFELVIDGVKQYAVFDGSSTTVAVNSIAADLDDTENVTMTINVYLGYIANVYVPSNYIGPADGGTVGTLPYKQTATAPADLATTSFGIDVSDATPAAAPEPDP